MSDALISPPAALAGALVSASCLGFAVNKLRAASRVNSAPPDKKIPLMAASGAFVFAGQMVNFAIPGTGASGHIIGSVLLCAVLGPCAALVTIAAVLTIQCLFFADGGLLALGCNILNMGVIPCFLAYPLIFRPLARRASRGRITAAAVASCVLGLQIGALGVVIETVASGVTGLPFGMFAALMLPIHLCIGLAEGALTALALNYVSASRPEILEFKKEAEAPRRAVTARFIAALAACAVFVGGLSVFASKNPDGLEWALSKFHAEK
jgi:cobalt/nickel transport system permease protein